MSVEIYTNSRHDDETTIKQNMIKCWLKFMETTKIPLHHQKLRHMLGSKYEKYK